MQSFYAMTLADHYVFEFLSDNHGKPLTVSQIRRRLPVDVSRSTIVRAISRLENSGLISVDSRVGSNYGNVYNVCRQ